MKPTVTRTIVQTLDSDNNVISETITTVEVRPVESAPQEAYGLYL